MTDRRRTLVVLVLAVTSACVSGLEPGELGTGRAIGAYPGEPAAVLPPMTDLVGNVYVATGMPDVTGAPQPGTVLVAGARGGWSAGCATGDGPRGGARGWLGATAERGWLWTEAALIEIDAVTGDCTTKLDRDPVSTSDVTFVAAASVVTETVSGTYALAAITTGAAPQPTLVAIDLDLGVIRASAPLGDVTVLGGGAAADGRGLFLVREAAATQLLVVTSGDLGITRHRVSGEGSGVQGGLAGGFDGTYAGVLANGTLLVGTADDLRIESVPGAIGIERDDDDRLWLTGAAAGEPWIAPLARGDLGAPVPWNLAAQVRDTLADGLVVIDERSGQRTASRWIARSALGDLPLVSAHAAPAYGVGARVLLVGDRPVDRGGIPYSQLAIVPVGVTWP